MLLHRSTSEHGLSDEPEHSYLASAADLIAFCVHHHGGISCIAEKG